MEGGGAQEGLAAALLKDRQGRFMRYSAKIDDRSLMVEVNEVSGKLEIKLDGRPVSMDAVELKPPGLFSVLIDNRSVEVEVEKNSGGYLVHLDGRVFECRLEDERLARLKGLTASGDSSHKGKELKAPMPGLVLAVEIKEGDRVHPGQGLVIIEAMKMENEIKVAFEGTAKSIRVKPGKAVEKNEVMIVFD